MNQNNVGLISVNFFFEILQKLSSYENHYVKGEIGIKRELNE
jgi:hypothetical protein